MTEKPSVTLPAIVEKIVPSHNPAEPDKAQITIQKGAEPLYQEIRIDNNFVDENGQEVKLKQGAKVEVTVEASPSGIIPPRE